LPADNGLQPPRKGRGSVQLSRPQVDVRSDKGLLRRVLSQVRVAQIRARTGVSHVLKTNDDFAERIGITRLRQANPTGNITGLTFQQNLPATTAKGHILRSGY
jgi:hypothetical protein